MTTFRTDKREYREGTLDAYRRGVVRAVELMRIRLSEHLTIDDLAAAATMSRFHFARAFSRITGVTPGRFLAAVRMQEAKRLLLLTDKCITDVAFDSGYNSIGTFSKLFADFVGFNPLTFRGLAKSLLRLPMADTVRMIRTIHHQYDDGLRGEVLNGGMFDVVVVAAFRGSIPRSRPIACVCLNERSSFTLPPLPAGSTMFAVGVSHSATFQDSLLAAADQIQTASYSSRPPEQRVSMTLVPPRTTDPPIVAAFPLFILELLSKIAK